MSIPSPEEILEFLTQSPSPQTKRELVKAFGIRGDSRVPFKKALRALENDGLIVKQAGGGYSVPDAMPSVSVIEVIDIDIDGDVLARPAQWNTDIQGNPPRIEIMPDKKGHPSLGVSDRILARLERQADGVYQARTIRRLDTPKDRVMGVIRRQKNNYILQPTDKKARYNFDVAQTDLGGAKEGDLAIGELQPGRGLKNKKVRIVDVIGVESDPKAISLISAHEMGLREEFPDEVLKAAEKMKEPELKGREDLRDIPLVTIDGADARDFDDAVFAEKTDGGGFHLIVAIADVAYYVQPDSPLDREAYKRGNSTYFPDRVIPMLPEALSNDLCSLRSNENRACMAVHMQIGKDGALKSYKFVRGLMRSAARLTYEQVQAAKDGVTDDATGPIMDIVINPLYEAYDVLWKSREKRGALDLDLPERQILINDKGDMTGVKMRERLDSHKLIEEFMILANVAAASALEDKKAPCVYRIHDRPDPAKLDSVREFIEGFGLSLPKGQVIRSAQINAVLHQAKNHPFSHLVSQVVLRAQSQAIYHPDNIGHFGLALNKYAHFTSPIRRYADLLVHRSLIRSHGLGAGGIDDGEVAALEEKTQHISQTERQSMQAERSATDRFTAGYLVQHIGAEFAGRISGVSRFGLFVALEESGADGLIPIRTLPDDYYIHDEHQHALIGRNTGRVYRMGAQLTVRLKEADGLTGSTILELINDEGADIPGLKLKTPKPARRKDTYKRRKKKGPRGKRK